jgi:hypothetical protein
MAAGCYYNLRIAKLFPKSSGPPPKASLQTRHNCHTHAPLTVPPMALTNNWNLDI